MKVIAVTIYFLLEGILAGWIFYRFKKKRRFSLVVNLLLGITGIFLGAILSGALAVQYALSPGIASLLVIVGHPIVAVALLFLANLRLKKRTNRIFLSYRRHDRPEITECLYTRLVDRFGKDQVFRDKDSIPLAVDFREYLRSEVRRCDVLIAVIGDQWLEIKDHKGNRRINDKRDFVRIEIESAIKYSIPVIPLLVGDAIMPGEDDLPSSLKDLAYRHSLSIRTDDNIDKNLDHLVAELEKCLRA